MSKISSKRSFTFLPVFADTSAYLRFSYLAKPSASYFVTFLNTFIDTWRYSGQFYSQQLFQGLTDAI